MASNTKSVTRPRANPPEYAGRIEHIAGMMRRLEWRRGGSGVALAREWGVLLPTVERMAAEASRIVAREVTDPEELKVEVATVLRENLHRASQAGEFGDVAKLGDVVTKIVGARAPERVEHAHIVARYEQLPSAEKSRTLRDKAAALLAEADRLDGIVSVETDAVAMA